VQGYQEEGEGLWRGEGEVHDGQVKDIGLFLKGGIGVEGVRSSVGVDDGVGGSIRLLIRVGILGDGR